MVKYQSGYEVPPVSRHDLRVYAKNIRNNLGLSQAPYFPIVALLEAMYPMGINQDIFDDDDWNRKFGKAKHAVYSLTDRIINIKQSVYDGAVADCGRDRFTIAHEIAHALLLDGHNVQVAKSRGTENIPVFKDPEWQADCLAGELLMPYHLCRNMSVQDIMVQCKVTEQAARCQKSKF